MTDSTQGAALEPLWSDDRIYSATDLIRFDVRHRSRLRQVVSLSEAEALASDMRDEYEAALAAKDERLIDLMTICERALANSDAAQAALGERDAKIAALEARLRAAHMVNMALVEELEDKDGEGE
jgi:DNA-binding transcriptional MerR regulator